MDLRRVTKSIDIAGFLHGSPQRPNPADRAIGANRERWERWREGEGLEDRRRAEIEAETTACRRDAQ